MSFGLFLAISALVLIVLGWWLGYRSQPNREARALLKNKQDLDRLKKEREEAEGREKNRQAVFQQDAVGAFEKILMGRLAEEYNASYGVHGRDPNRFERSYPAVHAFLKLFKHHEFRTEDVLSLKLKAGRQQKVIDAQAQQIGVLLQNQKDIFKALQMGQPLEFAEPEPKE